MKGINREHIQELLKLINHGPYFELLNMRVCELEIGFSKVIVDLQQKHYNPFGAIHGGVYSSIIDTAAYWSVYCELDENIGYTSIDVSVNNLSMVREGEIIVEGKSIKAGQSICLAEAYARDTNGKLLAHGTSKLMILNGKQSIEHAIEAMGHRPLPSKFTVV
jgi:uncharacterized protein (TIGR00369 family)